MIFNNGKIYATVWKINKSEKYMDLQISTSEKDQDGKFINSTWWPRVIGHAFNSLKEELSEGDFILINKCKFTNESRKNDDGTYAKPFFRFVVLDAEIVEKKSAKDAKNNTSNNATQTTDDSCPW